MIPELFGCVFSLSTSQTDMTLGQAGSVLDQHTQDPQGPGPPSQEPPLGFTGLSHIDPLMYTPFLSTQAFALLHFRRRVWGGKGEGRGCGFWVNRNNFILIIYVNRVISLP